MLLTFWQWFLVALTLMFLVGFVSMVFGASRP